MTKQEIQQRVLQGGKPIAFNKFGWDEETKTFSSDEDNLLLDFADISYYTFITGSNCIFKTGSICIVFHKDRYEVIELKQDKTIKLNGCDIKGFVVMSTK